VLDGLAGVSGCKETELAHVVKRLSPRWFLLRDARARSGLGLMRTR
jgi:hypothetical protein